MIVTEAEQTELQHAILAYWDSLGMDSEPTPAWKRWVYRRLFGVPVLAPEDHEPTPGVLTPYEILADAQDVLPMLAFHLERLVSYPHGAVAGLLLERMATISGRALEIRYMLAKLEEAEDGQEAA
jgi:hypothetical protein